MTEQPSAPAPESPSTEAVRRSLRALATSTAGAARPASTTSLDEQRRDRGTCEGSERDADPTGEPGHAVRDPDRVVHDAERAVSAATAAAAYLAAGRLPNLSAAIEAADRRGAVEVAERGRDARATLRRLEAALSGEQAEPRVGTDRAPTDPQSP
ncbi:hypothetical protein [Halobellus ordinarius]|uniref:hypothetical protein n=1 Tax=Halobellus ordinarius TaxID=3075120 RepID=UPI00287FF893|nr:hypothetical protein [Halobellus sp. ZY16]